MRDAGLWGDEGEKRGDRERNRERGTQTAHITQVHIYIYIYMHIHIHTHRGRERAGERERDKCLLVLCQWCIGEWTWKEPIHTYTHQHTQRESMWEYVCMCIYMWEREWEIHYITYILIISSGDHRVITGLSWKGDHIWFSEREKEKRQRDRAQGNQQCSQDRQGQTETHIEREFVVCVCMWYCDCVIVKPLT